MKIIICEFNQETNSFSSDTKIEDYERGGIFEGEKMRMELSNRPCAVAGMLKAAKDADAEVVTAYSMYAQSGGPVEQKVVDIFLEKTLAVIRKNIPADGVFISFHGATQSTQYDDVCGLISEAIRKEVGDDPVIAASCDLHANITDKMVENCNVICGYHTYPHTDFFETGYRAAQLGFECIVGEKKLHMVRVKLPMIVPASTYTTLSGPFSELMSYGKSLVKAGKLQDFSIFQMQPWLDVEKAGSVVLAISTEHKVSEDYAVKIAKRLFEMRKEFAAQLYSIDEVIDLANDDKTYKPVILVDSADSSNAGAPGDNAAVLKRLIERNTPIKAAIVINDPIAAERAHELGVGGKALFSIGGTKDPGKSESVQVEACVKSLHEGIFHQEGPAGRGLYRNIGHTAVLSIGSIDVVVCHQMSGNGDPQLYRAFGVEPTFYQLVVVKACTSFRAAYGHFAKVICNTNTPGSASVDLKSLDFRKIPDIFYPFNELDDYEISDILHRE